MTSKTDWVAVDWGTSNVRAWGIAADGGETFAVGSDRGMGKLSRDQFPAVLDALIGTQTEGDLPIIICGMAGARQGWIEAPYLDTPANLHEIVHHAVRPEGADPRFAVRILPGVCQRAIGSEDVMRGEETQLLGLLGLRPDFEGTAILPGTHSKWAEIRDGRIIRFSSAMTGELYEVLSQHSVLRHSFSGEVDPAEIEYGIAEGIIAGIERPALVTSAIFRTRAAGLVSGKGAGWSSGYLSGLLVGAEIGGHRDWLDGAAVPLIGSARFGQLYGAALKTIGIIGEPLDVTEITIAGLMQAKAQLQ
ncbi:MAG: 2-dehydro-3-deoxygalactonokinase [Devosia sp.]